LAGKRGAQARQTSEKTQSAVFDVITEPSYTPFVIITNRTKKSIKILMQEKTPPEFP
jgi:hypothetical protein